MGTQVMPARTVRWSAWDGCEAGLEHLEMAPEGDHGVVESVVIGSIDGKRFGLHYGLVIDAAWRVREARLATTAGGRLLLIGDGRGGWHVNGEPSSALKGCIDIDIQATPFTNTLPIRRLTWEPGESRVIFVAYVNVPSLTVEVGRQRYTAAESGGSYRFESLDEPFEAQLRVDPDGLVLDYPGLFRRLA
jgi:hypothetical protein